MLSLITRLYCSFDFFVYFLYPFLFSFFFFFFFNDTATTEIYTLSLHDALPISLPHVPHQRGLSGSRNVCGARLGTPWHRCRGDRKSTRLNSSHGYISYAVFCLKKKKKKKVDFNSISNNYKEILSNANMSIR